jgi:hypothetical protein
VYVFEYACGCLYVCVFGCVFDYACACACVCVCVCVCATDLAVQIMKAAINILSFTLSSQWFISVCVFCP